MNKQASRRSITPVQAIQTSRHLHVTAHRHTGHVLPRRTTSYPTLAMIVLCVGVFLASWTHVVTADQSYLVRASVPGPPPSVAATVDTPVANSRFTSAPITVSGSCPLNSYVGLTRNGFSSGVALCDATGHYQIASDLFAGINQLVTYDYSFTDAQGPTSSMTTVMYAPQAPPRGSGTGGSSIPSGTAGSSGGGSRSGSVGTTPYNPSSASSAGLPEPLLLKTNFTFLGYYVGQPASWQVKIEGGTAPYAIDAEWGDGTQRLYSQPKSGVLSLEHTYAKTGGYHGSYVVKITATDAAGNQTYLQLLSIITARPKAIAASGNQLVGPNSGTNLSSSLNLSHMVSYVWSGYGVVILMLFSFWLGERRELGYVRVHTKRHGHA